MLWDTVGATCGRPPLSKIGEIIDHEVRRFNQIYNSVRMDQYVIMPNHIHMIIIIEAASERVQIVPTLSHVIQQFKGSISKHIGYSIWQKSFYDHVIRSDEEYQKINSYIGNNPINWEWDCFFIKSDA